MKCEGCKFYCEQLPPAFGSGSSIGQCRIRSTPGVSPSRRSSDWCGEFVSTAVMVPVDGMRGMRPHPPRDRKSEEAMSPWMDR